MCVCVIVCVWVWVWVCDSKCVCDMNVFVCVGVCVSLPGSSMKKTAMCVCKGNILGHSTKCLHQLLIVDKHTMSAHTHDITSYSE